ncbi:MAG TPA: hypothetical protein PK289_00990 [Bacteroidia bacterium]|nr:hypothetical protein [Bacteroidia bacterium]
MPSNKIYNFHCLICGDAFKVERCDAQTCSKNCRVALHKLKKHGVQTEQTTPEEDKDIKSKMESVTSGGAKAAITPSHNEDKKSTIPTQTQKVLDDIKANKPKKERKAKAHPQNDKNLIPGKAGKIHNSLNKQKKKAAKKGGSSE